MKKQRRNITLPTLLKLRDRMIREAQFRRNPCPEEIAQEYVLRLLSGLHQRATVSQAYVDIMRGVANSRSVNYQAQLNLQRPVSKSDAVLSLLEDTSSMSLDDRILLKQVLSKVKSIKMKYIIEMRLEGYTYGEIALDLGVTESYIHQLWDREVLRISQEL